MAHGGCRRSLPGGGNAWHRSSIRESAKRTARILSSFGIHRKRHRPIPSSCKNQPALPLHQDVEGARQNLRGSNNAHLGAWSWQLGAVLLPVALALALIRRSQIFARLVERALKVVIGFERPPIFIDRPVALAGGIEDLS